MFCPAEAYTSAAYRGFLVYSPRVLVYACRECPELGSIGASGIKKERLVSDTLHFWTGYSYEPPNYFNMSLKQNSPPGCCCISGPIDAKQQPLLPKLIP